MKRVMINENNKEFLWQGKLHIYNLLRKFVEVAKWIKSGLMKAQINR
jgi:hypothetical protein